MNESSRVPLESRETDGLLARGLVNLVPDSGRSGSVVADVYAIIGSLRVTIPWRSATTRTSMLGVVPLVFEILPVACWYEEDVSRGEYGRTSGSFKNSSNNAHVQDVRPSRKKDSENADEVHTNCGNLSPVYVLPAILGG